MRRINHQVRQRRRQTWLDKPAHGIEEAGYGQEQCERSAKAAAKRKERGEEEIRLHCLPGTCQALAELMAWSGIEEQGEAITLMIHHLHGLGPGGALPLLEPPPRHEYVITENVSRKLKLSFRREELRTSLDEG